MTKASRQNWTKMMDRRTKKTAKPAKTAENDGLALEMADQVGHDEGKPSKMDENDGPADKNDR